MKKNNSFLYELIHSLSGNEKRYISLSVKSEANKNHFKLFNAIEKQENFDERTLRVALQNESFVRHLPVLKHYLYDYILKKLHSFYYGVTLDVALQQSFVEAKILFKKNLFHQCKVKLTHIQKLAQKEEDFIILLRCAELERELIEDSDYPGLETRDVEEILQRELSLTRQVDNLNKYKTLSSQVFISIKGFGNTSFHHREEILKKYLKEPLIQNEKNASSLKAKTYFHFIRSTCYNYLHDYPNTLKSVELLLSLMKPYIYTDESKLDSYLAFLNNKAHTLISMQKYEDALLTIDQLRLTSNPRKKMPEITIRRILITSYTQEMNLYMHSGQYDKALDLIPVIEKVQKKYPETIEESRQLLFYFHFAYVHFIFGNYKKAHTYLFKILNYKGGIHTREDIYCHSKIVQLLIFYESGKESFPKGVLQSAIYFINKKEDLYPTEKVFLLFLRDKLLKNLGASELQNEYHKIRQKIIHLQKNLEAEKTRFYFDFIAWIDSKIKGQKFKEVLIEKNNRAVS